MYDVIEGMSHLSDGETQARLFLHGSLEECDGICLLASRRGAGREWTAG